MYRLLILLAVCFFSYGATADEFGDRFYGQAPKGLGDYTVDDAEVPDIAMDDAAEEMQEIMPAAGGDASAADPDDEGAVAETD